MNFSINSQLFNDFDNPRIAITIVKNAVNSVTAIKLVPELQKIITTIQQKYTSTTLSQQAKIANWREAYRKFGSKPSEFPRACP